MNLFLKRAALTVLIWIAFLIVAVGGAILYVIGHGG